MLGTKMTTESKEMMLIQAAADGDAAVVKDLLASVDVDVNARGVDNQYTALMQIESGSAIGTNIFNSQTPLALAVLMGHRETCILLLDGGASIEVADNEGNTPLLLAASMCQTGVFSLLLERAAQTEVQNGVGQTPLMVAASKGCLQICSLLIEDGVDLGTTCHSGWTALIYAARFGHKEICSLLIASGSPIHAQSKVPFPTGYPHIHGTALHIAAACGHEEICSLVMEAGADVNTRTPNGSSALLSAATYGHPSICRLMIAAGADIDVACTNRVDFKASQDFSQDDHDVLCETTSVCPQNIFWQAENRYSILHAAAVQGHSEVCKILIEAGAPIEERTTQLNYTPLMLAVLSGSVETCHSLIEAGADVNAVTYDHHGTSALIVAVEIQSLEMCAVLVEAGADVDIQATPAHHTALMMAASTDAEEIVSLMINAGADQTIHCHSEKTAEGHAGSDAMKRQLREGRTLFRECLWHLKHHARDYDGLLVQDLIPEHLWWSYLQHIRWRSQRGRGRVGVGPSQEMKRQRNSEHSM